MIFENARLENYELYELFFGLENQNSKNYILFRFEQVFFFYRPK